MHINQGRLVAGAVLAAVLLFILEGIINGAILGADWEAWQKALGPLNHAPSFGVGMVIWAIVSLLAGFTGLAIYVGLRPRFGAGPKTAVLAAVLLWIPAFLNHALAQYALGDIPMRMIVIGCVGGLVAVLIAIVAGAAVYREP